MTEGCDMIASLQNLPEVQVADGIKIKRAFVGEKDDILEFVESKFGKHWRGEVEHALMQESQKCFIATENGKLIGFACYDATAKGFFGPIGIDPDKRGGNVGKALLVRTLSAMREYGYAYAIIGWVKSAEMFYRKTVNAEFIKGGNPENSIYANLISM
jgi:N-acetylglutamate synthase-like GNAT family acetyltransferase